MDTQVIHDHDLPRSQAGSQDLLDVEFKGEVIGDSTLPGSVLPPCRRGEGRQKRDVDPGVARHLAHRTLAFGCAGIQRRQRDMRAGFIHEHQVLTG